MKKQEKWRFEYAVPTSKDNDSIKCLIATSKEKVADLKDQCKKYGYRVVSIKKLYPFSTNRNQHNFELIKNRTFNLMYEMESGDAPWDDKEYDRLYELNQKAQQYCCYELPVAWVPWDEHQEMKELSMMAVNWRVDTCIKKGRPDLIQYC